MKFSDRHIIGLGIAAFLIATLILPLFAGAQHHGHAEHHDWYRDLKQPGSQMSCCNALTDKDPNGDCRPASVWRDASGNVWARVEGRTISVDPERVLPDHMNKQPLTGHYCGRNGLTYCALVGGAGG